MPQIIDHLHNTEKRWFAVYCYYKREKTALLELKNKGIDAFVPLISKTKKYERKIKHFRVPLINHYVFVRISKSEYNSVLEARDVIRFIKFSKDLISIPCEEIEILKRFTGESTFGFPEVVKPGKTGEEVEIISGNLAGIRAKLIKIKNNDQVVIDLKQLAFSLQLEISISQLKKINNPILM